MLIIHSQLWFVASFPFHAVLIFEYGTWHWAAETFVSVCFVYKVDPFLSHEAPRLRRVAKIRNQKAYITQNPAHHGGYTWMMSPGTGLSCAEVFLSKSTRRRAAVGVAAAAGGVVVSQPGGRRCWQWTSCMLHSSRTSRTSSTSTPGWTAARRQEGRTREGAVVLKVV